MSNTQAIAAVTSCLQQIVARAFDGRVTVTTKPLDRAGADGAPARLNLFLYGIAPNATWRNRDLPTQKLGERGRPPIALNLHYLLTAYGDDDIESHKLLGEAVGALDDHPILLPPELSTPPGVASGPNAAFERVHVTMHPLSIEDMSKLWSAFQSQYRVSVAYEASAALIESRVSAAAAIPVLHIGDQDRGPLARANLSALPLLEDITPRSPRAAETVFVAGRQLMPPGAAPGGVIAVLSRAGDEVLRIADVKIVPAAELPFSVAAGVQAARFTLPSGAASLEAGVYGVRVQVTLDNEFGQARVYSSNEIVLPIAPRIARLTPTSLPAGAKRTVTVIADPVPGPGQRVRLIVGAREFAPATAVEATLTFAVEEIEAGEHIVRLRVDGVDSLRAIRRSGSLEFEDPDVLVVTS